MTGNTIRDFPRILRVKDPAPDWSLLLPKKPLPHLALLSSSSSLLFSVRMQRFCLQYHSERALSQTPRGGCLSKFGIAIILGFSSLSLSALLRNNNIHVASSLCRKGRRGNPGERGEKEGSAVIEMCHQLLSSSCRLAERVTRMYRAC